MLLKKQPLDKFYLENKTDKEVVIKHKEEKLLLYQRKSELYGVQVKYWNSFFIYKYICSLNIVKNYIKNRNYFYQKRLRTLF